MDTTKKRILALPVMAATAALVLGGCVAVDHSPVSAPKTDTATEAPAEDSSEPTDDTSDGGDAETEPTEAPEASDGGGESQAPEVETIDLAPESGTLYLRSIQGFSPELETWVIDTEAGMVEYRRYSCLGTTQGVGVGTIAPREDADKGEYRVTWQGESPMRHSANENLRATVAEQTLEVNTNISSTHYDIELERFTGMCKDAGEMVAGFVL